MIHKLVHRDDRVVIPIGAVVEAAAAYLEDFDAALFVLPQ
jgi:hypothetical protein